MLIAELECEGFDEIETFGNHEGKPFDSDEDESLILVARRES